MSAVAVEPRQLPLDLDWPRKRALTRADFVEGDCNGEALAAVEDCHGWRDGRLVLCGDEGCGKTHLAAIWAARSGARFIDAAALDPRNMRDVAALGAVIIEDVDRRLAAAPDRAAAEEALMHLFNLMGEQGGRVLFSAREAPGRWSVRLPDLASRLTLPPVFRVGRPDVTLLSHLLLKLFDDRDIALDPRVASFLSLRIERSFRAVHEMVEALDRYSVGVKRPISVGLAKEVFGW